MAERRKRKSLEVNHDYVFDRLLMHKLQQAYEILVPDNFRIIISNPTELVLEDNEDSCNLRPGLVGEAERRKHDRKSNRRFG
jgi:hypothetical protein